MATPKKKHLVELMIDAGVKWPDGAEYAAQDKKNNDLCFYRSNPIRNPGYKDEWVQSGLYDLVGRRINLPSLCRNWHQTIVTREQYAEAVAAAAIGGKTNQVRESEDAPDSHPEAKYCASVMRQMPDNTIEQLTADYHAKAAEADRLQSVADEALKAADDALLALEKAGELIGLVISIDTKPKHVEQPIEPVQPIVTDWRDLRVGDVVECVDYELDKEGVIIEIDHGDEVQPIKVNRYQTGTAWPRSWRFIRRP